jgi:hypothetical protein
MRVPSDHGPSGDGDILLTLAEIELVTRARGMNCSACDQGAEQTVCQLPFEMVGEPKYKALKLFIHRQDRASAKCGLDWLVMVG